MRTKDAQLLHKKHWRLYYTQPPETETTEEYLISEEGLKFETHVMLLFIS